MLAMQGLTWLRRVFLSVFAALLVLLPAAPVWAISASEFPQQPPSERVLDRADVLSRSATTEVSRQLERFLPERVDARLITVSQLDYGLSLAGLGKELLDRWSLDSSANGQLLFLIDTQTNGAAVVASPGLNDRVSSDLMRSTARTTMALPIRDGARFRQASLDGVNRLLQVLEGGEDPGEPMVPEQITIPSNIPTKEETAESNAFIWVVVLLVVGTLVPMATWWVFSR